MVQTEAIADEHLLRDMVSDATVSKLLVAFGKVCDVGAGIFTPNVIRIGEGGHHSPFCTIIRSTQEGRDRCAECDKRRAKAYRGNPNAEGISYDCHAGLVDFCEPIRASVKGANHLIGLFFAGQVLFDDEHRPTPSDQASLRALATDCRLDMDKLLTCYEDLPRLSRARVDEIRSLMRYFADLIGELVQQKAAAQGLLLDVIDHSSDGAAVAEAIRRHLEPSAVSIFLEGKGLNLQPGNRVYLAASTYEGLLSVPRDNLLEYSYGAGEGFTGWVYDTGQMLYVPDCQNEDCYPDKPYRPSWLHKVQEVPQWQSTRAFLGVPVHSADGKTVGVIRAIRLEDDRPGHPEPFSQDERELLRAVAMLVSAATRAARARDVELINDMMTSVALAGDYSKGARSILKTAMQMVPQASLGYIVSSLAATSGSNLRIEAYSPEGMSLYEDQLNEAYSESRGVVFHVVANAVKFCGNVPDDANKEGIRYVPCREGIRSELAVPILIPGRSAPVGAINLESVTSDVFTEEDARRLGMLATYAGVTLHNAKLVELSRTVIRNGVTWFDRVVQSLEPLLRRSDQR